MLTIRAMIRVGPWTLANVFQLLRDEPPENCQRCGVPIKEIWVCEMDEDRDLTPLNGQRVWRIGSTCGPALMQITEAQWEGSTREVSRRIGLAKRLVAVLSAAAAQNYNKLPAFFAERLEPLLGGSLSDHLMRHTGGCLAQYERALGLKKPLRR